MAHLKWAFCQPLEPLGNNHGKSSCSCVVLVTPGRWWLARVSKISYRGRGHQTMECYGWMCSDQGHDYDITRVSHTRTKVAELTPVATVSYHLQALGMHIQVDLFNLGWCHYPSQKWGCDVLTNWFGIDELSATDQAEQSIRNQNWSISISTIAHH